MADAYSIMAMAKTQGANRRAREEYESYVKRIEAEELRASKASAKGREGGGLFGSISSFFLPALMALVPGAGIPAMLLKTAIGTGIQKGVTEWGDKVYRKGESKTFEDVADMGTVSGIYGKEYEDRLRSAGTRKEKEEKDLFSQMLEIEQSSRWKQSIMTGLLASGKSVAGREKALKGAVQDGISSGELAPADLLSNETMRKINKTVFKDADALNSKIAETILKNKDARKTLFKDISIGEMMKAGMTGSAKEGWAGGFKKTGGGIADWWGGQNLPQSLKEAFGIPKKIGQAILSPVGAGLEGVKKGATGAGTMLDEMGQSFRQAQPNIKESILGTVENILPKTPLSSSIDPTGKSWVRSNLGWDDEGMSFLPSFLRPKKMTPMTSYDIAQQMAAKSPISSLLNVENLTEDNIKSLRKLYEEGRR